MQEVLILTTCQSLEQGIINMKNKVTIKSAQGEYLQHVIFEEQSAQEAWLQMLHDTHAWGKPEHTITTDKILTPAIEQVVEVIDDVEVVTQEYVPPVYETIEVPAEYEVEIVDITEEINAANALAERKAKGSAARKVCTGALDLIAGYNLERELTAEQITQMQSTFGSIQSALMTSRPSSAKVLIEAIVPDDVIVTADMKAEILNVLTNY